MSNGKRLQAVNADVLAAEEVLRRAKVERDEAEAALSAARMSVREAFAALQAAKIRADDHLPRAESCVMGWAEGRPLRRVVVIARRTAKTIMTRIPGEAVEQQWRKDKGGRWRQWPGRKSGHWLELPEGAQ